MINASAIKKIKLRNSISTRLLKIVLSIYFILTFVVTAFHIFIEYSATKNDVKSELIIIEQTFVKSLSTALWNYDYEQLIITASGITQLPTIIGIETFGPEGEIVQQKGVISSTKDKKAGSLFWHEFPLSLIIDKKTMIVGTVRIYSSNQIVFNRIKLGIIILVIGAILKTITLVFLITVVFKKLLTEPLQHLAADAENIDPNNIQARRISVETTSGNELKVLEVALNKMMDKIVVSMSELDDLNKDLEQKVKARTQSLNEVIKQLDEEQAALKQEVVIRKEKEQALLEGRRELKQSLQDLKQTQDQLIEAEKMASLGGLVAGVAHEINTPVGLSLTGITHFQFMLEKLEKRYKEGELEEAQFEKFITDAKEIGRSIQVSLERAAGLVKSFKQVAVDQTHEVIRQFNMHEYVDEVLLSLGNRIKHSTISVNIECPDDMQVKAFPGVWSQIITNFINNSLIHAFDKGQSNEIKLQFERKDEQLEFTYSDNGKGMDDETQNKVFEPFFTTNRDQGGSGLGLNIVYNLVTQKLKGTIKVRSKPDSGTVFTILTPIDLRKYTPH